MGEIHHSAVSTKCLIIGNIRPQEEMDRSNLPESDRNNTARPPSLLTDSCWNLPSWSTCSTALCSVILTTYCGPKYKKSLRVFKTSSSLGNVFLGTDEQTSFTTWKLYEFLWHGVDVNMTATSKQLVVYTILFSFYQRRSFDLAAHLTTTRAKSACLCVQNSPLSNTSNFYGCLVVSKELKLGALSDQRSRDKT